MKFFLRVIVDGITMSLATLVLPGLDVVGGGDTTTTVLVFSWSPWCLRLVNANGVAILVPAVHPHARFRSW